MNCTVSPFVNPPRPGRVKYDDPVDAAALVALLDAYARDPMGGGSQGGRSLPEGGPHLVFYRV